MTSAQRQIALSIVDLLKAGGVAGGQVFSARTRSISADQPTAVVVRLVRSASQLSSVMGGRTNWATLIEIECYGRNVGGAPDQAADELVVAVFEQLDVDPTLAGQAEDVEPLEGDTLEWEIDELDSGLACITAKFIVKHQTTGRKLTQ
jgi:hypothetical protein